MGWLEEQSRLVGFRVSRKCRYGHRRQETNTTIDPPRHMVTCMSCEQERNDEEQSAATRLAEQDARRALQELRIWAVLERMTW